MGLFFLTIQVFSYTSAVFISDTTVVDTIGLCDVETDFKEADIKSPIKKIVTPLPLIGSVGQVIENDHQINYEEIVFSENIFTHNFLQYFPGVFLYPLSSTGQYHQLTINYQDFRSISIMRNGNLLNDPLTNNFNFYSSSSEDIYRIEYINPVRAFVYGLNNTGGGINLVSKSPSEGISPLNPQKIFKPYSKIKYSESTYEETFLDAMISQNIFRNFNFTGGLQRISTDGRYTNSEFDSWNVRAKLRYNLSDKINFYFSENFHQHRLGLNGGVDLDKTFSVNLFDRFQAIMRNQNAYEKIARNDLQLGTTAALFRDTSLISKLTIFLSNQMRLYRDSESQLTPDNLTKQTHHSRWMGFKFNQQFNFIYSDNNPIIETEIGVEYQSRQILQSSFYGSKSSKLFSLFGIGLFKPFKPIAVRTLARFDDYTTLRTGYGNEFFIALTENFKLYSGFSVSYRHPTFQELYWIDSSVTRNEWVLEPEEHKYFEVGINYNFSDIFNIKLTLFNRDITNQILVEPGNYNFHFPSLRFIVKDLTHYRGINTNAVIKVWKFTGKLNGIINLLSDDNLYPDVSVNGDLFFRDQFFNNYLDLKFGIKAYAATEHTGFEFNPQAIILVPSARNKIGNTGSIDIILLAKIGQATIHFNVENVLDNQYAVTTYYPVLDRSLRFGINWEFEN